MKASNDDFGGENKAKTDETHKNRNIKPQPESSVGILSFSFSCQCIFNVY